MKQIHYINGKEVKPPKNYQDVYLQGNKDNDGVEIATSVKTFEWINAEAAILKGIFQSGIGGQGILAGVPHRIVLTEDSTTITIFEGYIDLQTATYDQDLVTADSVPERSIEWLNDVASSVSFERLYSETKLNVTDVVFVPYVLTSIPNYQNTMLISLASTYIINSVIQQTIRITQAISKGTFVVSAVSGIIELVAEILYTIILLISLIKVILDLVDLIIQKIKYVACMSVNRQIEVACQELGLTYQPGVLAQNGLENMYLIPRTYTNEETATDDRIVGFLSPNSKEQVGYYSGTLEDLLRELRILFNLKYKVQSGILTPELQNQAPTQASFTLPPIDNDRFTVNADELISNYYLEFAIDTTEKNTITRWEGNNVQVSLQYKTAPAKEYRLLKGFTRVSTTFARGFRKTELTSPERILNAFYKAINAPLGALIKLANTGVKIVNGILDLLNKLAKALKVIGINLDIPEDRPKKVEKPKLTPIENRLGMLQLENDFFNVDKLVILDVNSSPVKTKVSALNELVLNARSIYEAFHKTKSFAPTADSAQRYIYEYENVQVNLTDIQQIINDGAVKLPSGEVCELVSYEYNAEARLAKFVIRQKKLYSNNLVENIVVPTGR